MFFCKNKNVKQILPGWGVAPEHGQVRKREWDIYLRVSQYPANQTNSSLQESFQEWNFIRLHCLKFKLFFHKNVLVLNIIIKGCIWVLAFKIIFPDTWNITYYMQWYFLIQISNSYVFVHQHIILRRQWKLIKPVFVLFR